MSLKEAEFAIRHALLNDEEALTTPGNCRVATETLASIAAEVIQSEPVVQPVILTSKEGETGTQVHYALGLTDGKMTVVVNAVADAGYPRYFGPIDTAPGLLRHLQVTDSVV